MSKKKINFIKRIAKELGYVKLSAACGKYFELSGNDEEILVRSVVGKNGYKMTNVDKLKPEIIDAIYKDLKIDFV